MTQAVLPRSPCRQRDNHVPTLLDEQLRPGVSRLLYQLGREVVLAIEHTKLGISYTFRFIHDQPTAWHHSFGDTVQCVGRPLPLRIVGGPQNLSNTLYRISISSSRRSLCCGHVNLPPSFAPL